MLKTLGRSFALLLVAVGSAVAQVKIPDTPAGHTLQAWLDAFNSDDRAKVERYIKTIDLNGSADQMISFSGQTGGFELLSIESSEPLHLHFRVKEKGGPTTALGSLLVKKGSPRPSTRSGCMRYRRERSSRT